MNYIKTTLVSSGLDAYLTSNTTGPHGSISFYGVYPTYLEDKRHNLHGFNKLSTRKRPYRLHNLQVLSHKTPLLTGQSPSKVIDAQNMSFDPIGNLKHFSFFVMI
jgi:hypothetical protein